MFGTGFAKVLLENINKRFPGGGTMVEERCVANLLDPVWKGVHLKVKSKFETTKELIKRRWAYLVDKNHGRADQEPSVAVPLSPTTKLLREAGVMPDVGLGGGLAAELLRFESLPRLEKDGDRLLWWSASLPMLAISLFMIVKEIFIIQASSYT